MLDVRIKTKHDTTANWNDAHNFIPLDGELIIYDDYTTYTVEEQGQIITKYIPNMKIGDGSTYVQDLPFVDKDTQERLLSHIADNTIHINSSERTLWNNKINIDDSYEIIHGEIADETLVFTRN